MFDVCRTATALVPDIEPEPIKIPLLPLTTEAPVDDAKIYDGRAITILQVPETVVKAPVAPTPTTTLPQPVAVIYEPITVFPSLL